MNEDEDIDEIPANVIEVDGVDGLFIEKASLLEKYMRRPNALKDLTYCQFCQRYQALQTLPKKVEEENFVNGCYTEE